MKTRLNKGFTLIELLVVIAIIGILSGIVLTNLGTARKKAKDTSAVASMSAMRSEAELALTSSGSYPDTICVGEALGAPLNTLADAVVAQGIDDLKCSADTNFTVWAAGSETLNFCVDSTGYAGDAGAGVQANGVCTKS